MSNGDYKVSDKRWEDFTHDEKLWLIYDTLNSYRETTNTRLKWHGRALIGLSVIVLVAIVPHLPEWAIKAAGFIF